MFIPDWVFILAFAACMIWYFMIGAVLHSGPGYYAMALVYCIGFYFLITTPA